MLTKRFIVILSAIVLASCSSIKSIDSPKSNSDSLNGLTYFMPKKDFLVTFSVKDKKIIKVAIGVTPSYPDRSKQYILSHGANVFGRNTLDVGVNEAGLLTSTKSTTISNVTDAFKNLATSVGQWETFNTLKMAGISDLPCTTDGDHIFVYQKAGSYQKCGMRIDINKLEDQISIKAHNKKEDKKYSGIFYRQNIPYLITVSGNGLNVASVVFSPSESETHFLPISRTFFSNNEADFALIDGIPTKYKQETEGEVVALFKLPADIIGAYFSAIGSVFDSFKSNNQKEALALAESLKLELEKKKYDSCISAIKAGDDELIKELGCQ